MFFSSAPSLPRVQSHVSAVATHSVTDSVHSITNFIYNSTTPSRHCHTDHTPVAIAEDRGTHPEVGRRGDGCLAGVELDRYLGFKVRSPLWRHTLSQIQSALSRNLIHSTTALLKVRALLWRHPLSATDSVHSITNLIRPTTTFISSTTALVSKSGRHHGDTLDTLCHRFHQLTDAVELNASGLSFAVPPPEYGDSALCARKDNPY